MTSSGSLTLAQILADLSDLQTTDNTAAHALLAANKTLSNSREPGRKHLHNSFPDRPKYETDKPGRRIVGARTTTPNMSRMDSRTSSKSAGSRGPPIFSDGSSDVKDEDLQRATDLTQLYEMRGKFKQMGDSGLGRAKERVDRVVERYTKMDLEEREIVAKARHSGSNLS